MKTISQAMKERLSMLSMRQRLQDPAWQKYIQSAIDAANADPPLGAMEERLEL